MFRRSFLAAVGLFLSASALTAQTPNAAPATSEISRAGDDGRSTRLATIGPTSYEMTLAATSNRPSPTP